MDNCPHCQQEMELNYVAEDAPIYAGKTLYVCHNCQRFFQACEIWSRVVGYLRPVSGWNKGKQAEFEARKEYKIEKEGTDAT